MGYRERILEAVGIPTAAQIDERVSRAYEAGFYDGGNDDPATGDLKKGGMGYRKLTDRYVREGRIDFQLALDTAWELWQTSPIAKRVLAMKRDHIIGHNATPTTEDADLLDLLRAFWDDNQLERRASEFTVQLFGFGEQCFPAFVRESDGRVRLGYIDPQNIEQVIKHPDNTLEDWAIVVKKRDGVSFTEEKAVYRIVRMDEEAADGDTVLPAQNEGKLVTWEQATLEPWEAEMLGGHGRAEYDGSCFYFKVNAVSNQSRGMSDLLQVGDWLDQADDVLFALADREQFAGYFSFDVALAGASQEQVDNRAAKLRANPPAKGSVNVHNDSEAWQMFSPDLKQAGSIETFRAILGLILGGMGFPVHWYGFGDDANRATAVAQADPTAKSLEHDQAIVRDMLLLFCRFVADQAEIAGNYTPEEEAEVTLSLPEVQTRDLSKIAASMQGMTISLVNAMDAGWITDVTAATAFAKVLAEMDIQIDPAEELDETKKADAAAELERVGRQNGQLRQAMNGQASAVAIMDDGNTEPA